MMNTIPIGFRFDPTDEELIGGFLYAKVTGLPLPWEGVTDRYVYGENAEPGKVFSDADADGYSYNWSTKKEGGHIKKTTYVFTEITKAAPHSKNAKRFARVAGSGTWTGQTGPKDIKNSETGATIGHSRMLTFEYSSDKNVSAKMKEELGHWIMHEYSLSDAALRMAGRSDNNIVLCKITKSIKKKEELSQRRPQIQQAGAAAVQYYSPAGNVNNKRGGEELEQQVCKKQKSPCFEEAEVGDFDFGIDIESLIDVSNLTENELKTLIETYDNV